MNDPMASIDAAKARVMREVRAAMYQAVDQSAKVLLEEMKLLTSRIDHSLKQLEEMGHPYRQGEAPGNPHPDWIVHLQSGRLQAGLKRLPPVVTTQSIMADLLSEAPYTWYLLLGTRRMRPRDFVSAAMITRGPEIERIFDQHFQSVMDRPIRTGTSMTSRLIEHTLYRAQLPGDL